MTTSTSTSSSTNRTSAHRWATAKAYFLTGRTASETANFYELNLADVARRIEQEQWDSLRDTLPRPPVVRRLNPDAHSSDALSIYFAGKIAKMDWRHTIVPGLRSAWGGSCLEQADPQEIEPVRFRLGSSVIDYAGPYLVGCDHGCFHGRNSHGAIDWESRSDRGQQRATYNLCLKLLKRADVVFAHIETADAHGTLFELGCAAGRIPIFLNFVSESLARDCWFAAQSARQVSINPSAVHALSDFLPDMEAALGDFRFRR